MANKNTESEEIQEIRKALESNKLIIGTERTIKELKRGTLSKVFISSNCPTDMNEDLAYYKSLENVEMVNLSMANDELGVVCKKPFAVSLLGFLKE